MLFLDLVWRLLVSRVSWWSWNYTYISDRRIFKKFACFTQIMTFSFHFDQSTKDLDYSGYFLKALSLRRLLKDVSGPLQSIAVMRWKHFFSLAESLAFVL